ncbi:carboxylesterase/lipase family protein [Sphingomonas sp. Leaf357]|uniref:carboxylesterase/lipase family protein n=1 Tax=Sphingomonas sp. Leaf357 TaxID=1736350 RepID=UPI001443E7CB|nr:carboxylesterase/lipase family protein [Sphingomonas sp. Leaf357]
MAPTMAAASGPQVAIVDGRIEGKIVDHVEAYLGIPYGADTGGAHRFQAPRPPEKWTGVRAATAMGKRCPQTDHKVPHDLIKFSADPAGEDCLVLNVWTPSRAKPHRPVMVWIHGGGYGFGSANDPLYDGAGLARNEGVVVVSLNHRLNALGYLNLGIDGAPANVGQLDIVQALRWIKANIARFGGDPANVTVFGQSGGGAKISVLLAMPTAEGLFHKAIIESGGSLKEQTPAEALAQRDKLLARLNLKTTEAAKLRDVPLADLTAAVDAVGILSFKPWIDGQTVPRQLFTPDAPKAAARIPLLIGTARDEATSILIANPMWPKMDEAMVRTAITPMVGAPNVDRTMAAYKARRPTDTASQIFASIFTDYGFTHSAQVLAARQAANNGGAVWMYRTDWQTPVLGGALRSPHGIELPFLFDALATSPELVGATPPAAMVRMFQHSFATFARTGVPSGGGLPSWPRYETGRRQTMVYDQVPHLVADPDPAIRALWDGITGEAATSPAASQ